MEDNNLQKLFDLIARLRGEDGCPWDRAQTLETILSDLIEEAYELQWAQARGSKNELGEELGDVLFVLVFAIALARETDPSVTVEKLADRAHAKIKRRHPHVFGDAVARTERESLVHWNRIKAEEKPEVDSLFDEVPGDFPPLRKAEKIQRLAAKTGFDWPDTTGIFQKIREEVDEVEETLSGEINDRIEEEIGDLFFSVVNLSRFLNVDGEAALARANAKFIKRYETMESFVHQDGHRLEELTLEEMDVYWDKTKESEP
jgi:tetrapyrrole methylase family protein/MazG family protein